MRIRFAAVLMGNGFYTNGNMVVANESLRNLCLQNLLRYPHLIENGFEDLPLEIIEAVLHSSIRSYSLTTFKHVLKFWPMRVVVLRGTSHMEEEGQFVGKAVAEYIPGRDETDTVQVIDIRERDLGFDGTTALCRAVIAANKPINLTDISSGTSPNRADNLTGAKVNSNVNPTSFLTIYLDISVNHCNPDTVFKALESNNGAVRLFVSSLTVIQLGDDRLSRFLKLLNPDHLLKLDFSYNGLAFYDNVNVELSTIFQEMKKFTKLRSLCLSYSDFGESHLRSLSEILQELPCLVSLDLSGNYVGNTIGLVLNSVRKPLNCLRLAKCRIGNAGINAIARSKHASQLTELDVSCNCLSSECIENLLYIFESSKNTIREFCVHGNQVPLLVNKE